jgi:hypothetical protein
MPCQASGRSRAIGWLQTFRVAVSPVTPCDRGDEYVENHGRAELLDQVLDEELPRYAEALERLAR